MNKVVILVHGYNVQDAQETTGMLRESFEHHGYTVEELNYGYLPFTWQITRFNKSVAKRLADRVTRWQAKGYMVDVVGHSNGCTIGHIATRDFGMVVNTFVAINPALKADLNPSSKAALVQVWHNDDDKAVVASKWLTRLTSWARRYRPWGEQGKVGYTGNYKNVVNFDCINDFKNKAYGHSAVFEEPASEFYMLTIPLFCDKMRRKV